MRQSSSQYTAVSELQTSLSSFQRHLRAENLSNATLQVYSWAVTLFAGFPDGTGIPDELSSIRREHIEAFIEDVLGRCKPATANNKHRGLQVFRK
jgi:hypothetical protein